MGGFVAGGSVVGGFVADNSVAVTDSVGVVSPVTSTSGSVATVCIGSVPGKIVISVVSSGW